MNLKQIFKQYNKLYFGGKLPANTVVNWKCRDRDLMGEAFAHEEPPIIRLNPNMKTFPTVVRQVLLHEMVHVEAHAVYGGKMRGEHGKWFHERMLELCVAGAFIGLW